MSETDLTISTESLERDSPEQGDSERTRISEIVAHAVTGVLIIGLFVGLAIGLHPLESRAAELRAIPIQVVFEWPPLAGLTSSALEVPGGEPRTWVNSDVRLDLERSVTKELTDNPLDGACLRRARAALLETGWFEDDLRVSRAKDGAAHVAGTWRIPVAALRVGDKDHLGAAGGERLPLAYDPGDSKMKVIFGVNWPLPEPGRTWAGGGGDVRQALKLLEYLRGMPSAEQVAGIDVSEFAGSRTLAITTEKGNRIIWGGPPDDFNPGQATALVKARRMTQLLEAYGRIDAGRPLVDLRPESAPFLVDSSGLASGADDSPRSARTRNQIQATATQRQAGIRR